MWSVDEGIDIGDVSHSARSGPAATREGRLLDRRERAAVAIANACLDGSSARFQLLKPVSPRPVCGSIWGHLVLRGRCGYSRFSCCGCFLIDRPLRGRASARSRTEAGFAINRQSHLPWAPDVDDKVGEGGSWKRVAL